MDAEYISNHIKCTWDEKILCLHTAEKLLNLARIARRMGLLELENTIYKEEYQNFPLLREGIILIVDGTDPVIVKSVLENYILSSTLTNKEFLESILIYTTIPAIQEGENPKSIEARLCSCFGIEFMVEFQKVIVQREIEEDLELLLRQNDVRIAGYHKTDKLDLVEGSIDNRSIQRVLREVSQVDLECALMGSSRNTIELFLKNLSKNNLHQFFTDIQYMDSLDKNKIERSQKEILEVIKRLEESGEIFIL